MNNKDIIIKEFEGIKCLQFKKLLDYGINHGFYIGRDLNFRTMNKVREFPENYINYKVFLESLGMDYNYCIKAIENHTSNVLVVDRSILKSPVELNLPECDNTDSLITSDPLVVLGTTAADCVLIYIYDPINNVIANIHSGWPGTLKNVTINTINKMVEEFSSNPKDLNCFINPCIRKHHFEVDDDVYLKFKTKYPDDAFYEYKDPKWYIDLVAIITSELIKNGVLIENIIDSNICSYCNKEIHSYRRDKEFFGLSAAFIKLKEE